MGFSKYSMRDGGPSRFFAIASLQAASIAAALQPPLIHFWAVQAAPIHDGGTNSGSCPQTTATSLARLMASRLTSGAGPPPSSSSSIISSLLIVWFAAGSILASLLVRSF